MPSLGISVIIPFTFIWHLGVKQQEHKIINYEGWVVVMKKAILAAILVMGIVLTGCGNKQIFDTKFTFTRAKIVIGNETMEIKVKSWKDYENDTQMQIIGEDDTVYLVDKANILLMSK